jgi:hypothetical protein
MAKTVTLDNGYVYKWPSKFDAAMFKVGEKVKDDLVPNRLHISIAPRGRAYLR